MGAIGELTWARLRHQPGRWALLVIGVTLALALPVLSAAIGHVVAVRTLSNAVERLPAGERTVIASYGGTKDLEAQRRDDGRVRAGISRLTGAPAQHVLLFGELADGVGETYRLAASDALADQVRLTSGRLPDSCTPSRCEVVLVGGTTAPALDPALGLVVVGEAERSDPLLLPGTFSTGPAARVLLGSDPDALQRLTSLERFPRGTGWVAALDTERISALGVRSYADLSREVSDDLALTIRALVLSVPDDALLREDARASTSQGRFALIGGAAAVLVLGFVLVAAAGLRREHREVDGLLRRRGASTSTLLAFAALGSGLAVAAGAVLGAALGWTGAWLVATSQPLHPPATTLATASVLDSLATLLLLAALAISVSTAVLVWPEARERTAWHVVELLALAAFGTAFLAAARGAAGVATVGGDPIAIALPALVLIAAGLISARLWAPIAAWVSRHLPASAVGARLAAASGARRPLRTAVTVGFVSAAIGAVVFAGAYRATLQAGSADTAAFEVPTDAVLTIGPNSDDPLPFQASDPLPGQAFPVLRTVAGVRTSATSADAVQVLGVEPASLAHVARWERTVGASDPVTAQRQLSTAEPTAGLRVADDARVLALQVRSWLRSATGTVDVTGWIRTPDGREAGVALVLDAGRLAGPLPNIGPGRTLTAITLRENSADATRRQHHVGEGGTATSLLAGTLTVVLPGADWSTWSSRTSEVTADADALTLGYELTGPLVVIRPGLVDRPPVRVLVDATTASRGTSLRLDLGAGDAVNAQVVGTLPRFPTLGPRFVVADRGALSAALNDAVPGTGAARELWADSGGDQAVATRLAAALTGSPYDRLAVTTRASRQASLESDAVAQGAGWLLLLAAAVSLLVAILSLVLLVTGERRDDAGQLLAQEADGVATSTLRRSLWLRAVAVATAALVAGTIAGLALSRAVASLLALSASGTAPTPPLVPAVGPVWTATVLLAGLGVALLMCALVAGRMLRSTWPAGADQDLR